MNYIREINAFYDWLETNSLSTSCIALWHALMAINNKAGWAYEFTVAISTLETKTGLGKKTIERCRNTLEQKGLIEWKERRGNQSAIYHMKNLCVNNDPQTVSQDVAQTVPQSVPQPVSQSVAINKLNKTKQREIERNHAHTRESTTPIVAEVTNIYLERKFRPALNEFVADEIRQLCTDYPEDWIRAALEVAGRNGARSLKYLYPVLDGWATQGFAPWERKEETVHAISEFTRGSNTGANRGGKKDAPSRIEIPDDWIPPVYQEL